ncbi:MAG: hypothetical protein ABL958_01890 [Bdellovibrionia bacterium]
MIRRLALLLLLLQNSCGFIEGKNSTPNGCTTDGGSLHCDYFAKVDGLRQIDILVVVDNSGSMSEEQTNMGDRFPNFIAGLGGTRWRLGITTTDVSIFGAQGRLLPFGINGVRYIDNDTPDAEAIFRAAVQIGVGGSGDERGIYAATLAVEANESNWIRSDSQLAVIILSDEDERGSGNNLELKDRPANFIATVKRELGQGKPVSVHSIVTRPGDTVCATSHAGSGGGFIIGPPILEYGTVYAELTQMTDGILGDICAANYASQLEEIADDIVSDIESFDLQCEPSGGVTVEISPAPKTPIATSVEGTRLYFERPLSPGVEVRLVYDCGT